MRVQQQLCVLRGAGRGEELQSAKQVLKEARNSRAVSVCACGGLRGHFVYIPTM